MNIDNAKKIGAYYTPYRVIKFIYNYLIDQNKEIKKVLEPCAGDGRFIELFIKSDSVEQLVGIELFDEKVREIKKNILSPKLNLLTADFLEIYAHINERFDAIVGNPPYINIKNMSRQFIESSRLLCKNIDLPENIIQNAWVSFVLAACQILCKRGVIFFVLPAEFLQVKYAEKLRSFLEKKFNTIHIISFKERMFPEIEQDVCLVYLTNDIKELPYILYLQYDGFDSNEAFYKSTIKRNKPLKKWSNAVLSDDEIDLLNNITNSYPQIKCISRSAPGIVTGANNKFILTKNEVIKYDCKDYIKPILSKSTMVKNIFEVNNKLISNLALKDYKVFLLDLAGNNFDKLPNPLQEYLKVVAKTERNGIAIQHSYKCSKRNPWYAVQIIKTGSVIFFKRYDIIPRLCTNPEKIYTTDIAYGLQLLEDIDPESLVFCFYNSLTLAQCEYVGRFYAGGVNELTPNEFRSLSIPYQKINKNDVKLIKKMFYEKTDIEEIVSFVNSRTLNNVYTNDTINMLNKIRKKLIKRRK